MTPLVVRVTPAGWEPTAPLLPLVVDAAVIVSVRLDATVARLGERGGGWATLLRWMTGLMTLLLNVGDSALKGDLVGVGVHAVIPLILIVIADAGLAWRRAIGRAQDRIAREQRAEEERSRGVQEARERRARQERESEREARERADREARDHAAHLEREAREHAAQERREEREHEERLRRQEWERQEAEERRAREEREREQRLREQQEREREQQRRDREQEERLREQQQRDREQEERLREQQQRDREQQRRDREHREREAAEYRERQRLLSLGPAEEKQPEDLARRVVAAAHAQGLSVRAAVELTGWSVGWVTTRYQELRDHGTPTTTEALEGAVT
ncbi:DUF2637 domain-containing protein [Streptomyces coffeae]|uniref:DUF2637 domain-containing protein n=1 Tax=Streptomyces coffeae TaxID=621382 RepID=UPI0027DCCBC1|nr:DUF2637 domain-containing protein [Streptomyces coffeae]